MCETFISIKMIADRAQPIAIMSEGSKLMPNVPTGHEQGFSDVEVSYWRALFLPKGASTNIVGKLHEAAVQARKTAGVRERFEAAGSEIVREDRSSPGFLGPFVNSAIRKWAETIKASGAAVQ